MIKVTSIVEAINSVLKESTGIQTVAYDDREGIEVRKPCFFVQIIIPLSTKTKNTNSMILTVYIHYFPKSKTNLENLEMLDTLNNVFGEGAIDYKGNTIECSNIRADSEEGILRYTFDIELEEFIEDDTSQYELMQTLHICKKDIEKN